MAVKKTTRPRKLFKKRMSIELVGTSKEAITRVAQAIHALDHPDRVGGANERAVYMSCDSEEIKQIYYGNV